MHTKHIPNSTNTQHPSAANGIPIQLQLHQQQQQPLPIKIKTSKKWILPPRPKPGRKPSQSISSSSNPHYNSPSSPSSTSCSINKDCVNTASAIRKKLKASCSSITGCSSNRSSKIKSKSLSPSPSPSSIESSPYPYPSSSSYQSTASPHSHCDTIVESSNNNSPSPISPISKGNNLNLLDESIILNTPIKKEILKINEENYYLKLQVIKLVSDLKNLKKSSSNTDDVVKVIEEKVVTPTANDKKRSHDDDINDLIISLIDLNHSQQAQSTASTAASNAVTITTANYTFIDNDTETITGGDYEDNLDYEEDFDLLTNESTTPIDLDNNQHPHPFENTTNVNVSNTIKKDEMLSLIKTNETIDSCISSSSSTLVNNSIDDNHSNHYYLPEKEHFQLLDIPNTSPITISNSIFSNSNNGDGGSNSIFKLTFESKLNERINEANDLTHLDDLYEKDYYTFTDMSNMNNYNYNNNNNETDEINNDKNTTAIARISNDLNNGININKANRNTNSINTIPNNVNTEFEKFINGELN